ncbi:GNAT family N-acetyltransferase [Paenibacillus sp. NPDC057967]|uniref:GNAT family N-acetyltransferase n=1 Tax=Paenibacillus sp. NPDC057967 TaxID=3346293 RepID=UPI0036D9C6E0
MTLIELLPDDLARPHPSFLRDEAAYQLFHAITQGDCAHRWKSKDGRVMFAQSTGYKGWLWLSQELTEKERAEGIAAICTLLEKDRLPGILSDPETADQFSHTYSAMSGMSSSIEMRMEAYACPTVRPVENVAGQMRSADRQDARVIAEFLAGFSEDAYGYTVTAESQLPGAERLMDAGHLYLWINEGIPVSMANIAHRSPRHARINAVYTPREHRKQGFASALVGEITGKVWKEGLTPMLYADLSNPHSNGVYRSLGYREQGQITDIRFY